MPRSETSAQSAAARLVIEERMRLMRLVSARLGGVTEGERFLTETLLRSIRQPDKLRRGECLPEWMERKTQRAVEDWYNGCAARRAEIPRAERDAWTKVMRGCLEGLLRAIEPRYEQVLRRVDLGGESKLAVARELRISRATMDVLLHRARKAVRRTLEKLCALEAETPRASARWRE